MNWGLVPEVFFDLIARLLPGSLFLVGALAVHLGPQGFVEVVVEELPSAGLATILLFGLLGYFAAIVLKELWELGGAAGRGAATEAGAHDALPGIRSRMPTEAARLLKIQAEKNVCEVMIPGGILLLVGDIWTILAHPSPLPEGRVALGGVLLISLVAFWRWRASLERLYGRGLTALERLAEDAEVRDP